MVFEDKEFDMNKAYRNFKNELQRILERKFTNADSIRSLEDNSQLALRLWNMPKFDSIEDLQKWLNKECREGDEVIFDTKRYVEDMIDGLKDPSYPNVPIKYEGTFTNNSNSGGDCNAKEKHKNSIQ